MKTNNEDSPKWPKNVFYVRGEKLFEDGNKIKHIITEPQWTSQYYQYRSYKKEWLLKCSVLNFIIAKLNSETNNPENLLCWFNNLVRECLRNKSGDCFEDKEIKLIFISYNVQYKLREFLDPTYYKGPFLEAVRKMQTAEGLLWPDQGKLFEQLDDNNRETLNILIECICNFYPRPGKNDALDIMTKQFNSFINRSLAFECIGGILNRAIVGTHAPNVRLLIDNNSVSILSRKACKQDLLYDIADFFDQKITDEELLTFRNASDNPEHESHEKYKKLVRNYLSPTRGVLQSMLIRIIFGDLMVDLKLENMAHTKRGAVNLDPGNFFKKSHNLNKALFTKEGIINSMFGNNKNDDRQVRQNFACCIKPFLLYLMSDEEAEEEIKETLESIINLNIDEIKQLIYRFKFKPNGGTFLNEQDAKFCLAFIDKRIAEVKTLCYNALIPCGIWYNKHKTSTRKVSTMNILFYGCGRMGGSLAKTLSSNKTLLNNKMDYTTIEIIGYDIHPAWKDVNIDDLNAFVKIYSENLPDEVIQQADIIIVCTPIDAFDAIGKQLKGKVKESTLVMDVGSRKTLSIESLSKHNLPNYCPIHPMVGGPSINYANGSQGIIDQYKTYSDDFLREKTVFCFPDEQRGDILKAQYLLSSLGAQLVETTPIIHDKTCALTSCLPQALASIFWHCTPTTNIHSETPPFAFQANKILDPMWESIYMRNSDMAYWLDVLKEKLQDVSKHSASSSSIGNNSSAVFGATKANLDDNKMIYEKILPKLIIRAISQLHDELDSPIKNEATGRGYQEFVSKGVENLEVLLDKCNINNLEKAIITFKGSTEAFLSAAEEKSSLTSYLSESSKTYKAVISQDVGQQPHITPFAYAGITDGNGK